ncbi:MAG: DegT/DnrJ/EryC1/StrS family aminotransferase [Candidatus Rokuibacteriota bacterium]
MATDSSAFVMPAEQQISAAFLRWRRVEEPGQPAMAGQRFFWARNAIYHALSVLGIGPADEVLLPAYICNAAVEPVLGRGAEVGFYDGGRVCEVDPAEIEARIGRRTRAVVIVHYFGFPQRVERLRELCDRRGVLLIEDCAHVLRSEGRGHAMGRVGDAAVFSWRKFLPVRDGAALVVNGSNRIEQADGERESLMLAMRSVKDLVDQVIGRSRSKWVKQVYRWAQAPKELLRRRLDASEVPMEHDEVVFEARTAACPVSRVSSWVLAHSDTASIAARRRENYTFLLEALRGVGRITPLHPVLGAGLCPWVFPVFFDGIPNGHWGLRDRGVPAVSWGGVRHRLIAEGAYPGADFLYENLVFLPVHQSLEREHLELIARCAEAVARGGQVETVRTRTGGVATGSDRASSGPP